MDCRQRVRGTKDGLVEVRQSAPIRDDPKAKRQLVRSSGMHDEIIAVGIALLHTDFRPDGDLSSVSRQVVLDGRRLIMVTQDNRITRLRVIGHIARQARKGLRTQWMHPSRNSPRESLGPRLLLTATPLPTSCRRPAGARARRGRSTSWAIRPQIRPKNRARPWHTTRSHNDPQTPDRRPKCRRGSAWEVRPTPRREPGRRDPRSRSSDQVARPPAIPEVRGNHQDNERKNQQCQVVEIPYGRPPGVLKASCNRQSSDPGHLAPLSRGRPQRTPLWRGPLCQLAGPWLAGVR